MQNCTHASMHTRYMNLDWLPPIGCGRLSQHAGCSFELLGPFYLSRAPLAQASRVALASSGHLNAPWAITP